MPADTAHPRGIWIVAGMRAVSGLSVIAVLTYAYVLRLAVGDDNPFDYFGYFTNQTSLLASVILIATAAFALSRRDVPAWLMTARGVVVAYLLIVAVVYNVLVPGTGSAPPWVSALLHVVFPIAVAADWLLVGDRPPLRWRHLWIVLPYPLVWLAVVLVRGRTDGWVPYGFLLPERGYPSLIAHVAGLLVAVLAAGALSWLASRYRGLIRVS